MEMNLQPLAPACYVTGQPFAEGQRVASFLVREAQSPDVIRHDVLESAAAAYAPPGYVACSWVQVFKPRRHEENSERAMKLTAETLFVTLADPATEPTPENTRLIQFLALMLERKRLLRPKGRSADGARNVYEHAKSKQLYEVPVGEMDPAFFLQVQAQLSVLVGPPKGKVDPPAVEPQLTNSL
jgi:hypothetical protein